MQAGICFRKIFGKVSSSFAFDDAGINCQDLQNPVTQACLYDRQDSKVRRLSFCRRSSLKAHLGPLEKLCKK